MSKSNADFSAFDFNDSSDNSDVETRGPFLSRVALNNSASKNNSNIGHTNGNGKSNNNINNNNNNNHNNSGPNSNLRNIASATTSITATNTSDSINNNNTNNNTNHLSSSASNSSASSSEDEGDPNDEDNIANEQQPQQQQLHEALNGSRTMHPPDDEDNNSNSSASSSSSSSTTTNEDTRGNTGVSTACINIGNANGSNAQPPHNTENLLIAAMGSGNGTQQSAQPQLQSPPIAKTTATSASAQSASQSGQQHTNDGNALDGSGPNLSGLASSLAANESNSTPHYNNSCNVSSLLESTLAAAAAAATNHSHNNGHSNASNSNCNEMVRSSSSASLSNTGSHAGLSAIAGLGIGGGGSGSGLTGIGGGSNSGAGGIGGGGGSVAGGSSLTGAPSSGVGGGTSFANSAAERKKYRHQNFSKNIYIGTKNAEKWEYMRTRLQFKNDVEFVAYLLNLADNDTERLANLPPPSASTTPTKSFDSNFKLEPNLSAKEFGSNNSQTGENGPLSQAISNSSLPNAVTTPCASNSATPSLAGDAPPPTKRKYKKRVQFNDNINGLNKLKNFSNFALKAKKQLTAAAVITKTENTTGDMVPEVLDCRIAEKIKSELEEKSASKESLALCLKKGDGFGGDDEEEEDEDLGTSSMTGDGVDGINNGSISNFHVRVKGKKGTKNMNPPPPASYMDDDEDCGAGLEGSEDEEEDEELDEEALAREMKNEQNFVEEEDELDIAFRSHQSCRECSLGHDYKVCPLRTAIGTVTDAVDLAEWLERKNLEALAKLKADAQRQAKHLHGDDDEDMDETSQLSELETKPLITFAEASVPAEFELHNVEPHVTGVFARTEVRAFTKLGPLRGQSVHSTDIREASDMKWIFEICEAGAEKSQFLLCDNPNSSNWLRYIRPAPSYDERNVNLVFIESQAFFVTCRDIKNGMELLYWSDDCNTMWRKKHWAEKTNCGGCNLKFDHPLYYRTHCSIFHDPTMSLTIRKYHCKVCGEAVLGKDNIMKHAAEKHDGKGAHQCQFCNKFFLRISYLDMHRTYGCAANPNRTRPICDFCGRKYYRPQKLKTHIRRMHSGSRAALQRHNKEVHSRNSTVVSCPRCQKLFQNRSNLKIHMLTHSGVRPFKCAEPECNAAFTTKQCLQFHYKKVHNYTQEQMPKIERSVAYTFDAYSGGMKVDFLEQAPRRRRKSLEDQNSIMSSSIQSDAEFSDDNIFEAIKKSGKSIKDLCRNEPNLSLLSSKISSIFGEKPPPRKRGRKPKDFHLIDAQEQDHMEQMRRKQNAQLSLVETFLTTTAQRLTAQQQVQQVVAAAAAVSAMTGAANEDPTGKMHMMPSLNPQHMGMAAHHHHHQQQQQQQQQQGGVGGGVMSHDEDDDEEDDDDEDQSNHGHHGGPQMTHDNNGYRHHPGMNAMGQNLVVSKGSKKWISGDDRHLGRDCAVGEMSATGMNSNANTCGMGSENDLPLPPFAVPQSNPDTDPTKLMGSNRDFLSRLINSANPNHNHHGGTAREEDENTSFLDVVESNNAAASSQMAQYHHNAHSNAAAVDAAANAAAASVAASNVNAGLNGGTSQDNNQDEGDQMSMSSLTQSQAFMSSFYNNANARLSGTATGSSSSASMLVEAALNSVGNMIDNENNDMKVPTESNINTDSPMSSHVDSEANRFTASNPMDNLESELKMMKNLNNFPMQIPPLPMFPNAGNNLNSCNISPSASTPTNPRSNQNEVDVDAGSTPGGQHMGNSSVNEADGFPATAQHRTPPTPQPISPGRDYGMFGNNPGSNGGTPGCPGTAGSNSSANSTGGNSSTNNISASSPLPSAMVHRRNAPSVGTVYPEHELISPASSPSIPRYNFNNGDVMRHKQRSDSEADRRHVLPTGHNHHHHLSSDEENSIMPQNSVGQDMRMKFPQSQMDLMYSKYESLANSTALKYNNQNMDSPSEYRNTNSAATAASSNDISDLQGLDMSSRSNVSASNYHHNFQLPSNSSANLTGIGRYHHHIYDILSEREQNQQSQQSQQHHSASSGGSTSSQHQQQEHPSQLAMQQHQSAMHSMLSDQLSEQDHDQATSVDLSRTANYVVPSPPQLPYNHPHHDMLRMASLDLTPNTNMSVGNNRSFLSSQMQHQSRESLEHHRLLSTVEQHRILAASNAADQHRLLVDPTAHLLMEQNNRLLGGPDQSRLLGESAQNRHMARGFGAYHQVASSNYHPGVRAPVLPSANHHASNPSNYHPFPAYY